jgi:two-component system chemotaxis sensor kinase CheA
VSAGFEVFIEEAGELLVQAENILLEAESSTPELEDINALFRVFHTIKGSGGIFDLKAIVHFTHHLETLLDCVRSEEVELTAEMITMILKARDHIEAMIAELAETEEVSSELEEKSEEILQELNPFLPADKQAKKAKGQTKVAEETKSVVSTWHVSVRLSPDVMKWGMDPLAFIQCLNDIGELKEVCTIGLSKEEFVPDILTTGFEFVFVSDCDEEEIVENFDFMEEGATIKNFSKSQKTELKAWIEEGLGRGESKEDWESAKLHLPTLKALVPKEKVAKKEKKSSPKSLQIKIDSERLDYLIGLMGEMVMSAASTENIINKTTNKALMESFGGLNNLMEEIRDTSLKLRMVPIGDAFNRFPRVVRDVSKKLDKQITLHLEGEDTELDRSLVEKIVDPLMHLVRNSLDHGIESPEKRVANGKEAMGNLRLKASTDSGSVCIELSDDGGGIPKKIILGKAIEKGIVSENDNLSDKEILKLIFAAGFSTAEQVSDISGRGVGMDVVKRNIEELRGHIELDSTEGEGTVFRLYLPLTLAIIDGFLIESSGQMFVLPLESVEECISVNLEDLSGAMFNLRGEYISLIHLDKVLKMKNEDRLSEVNILVTRLGTQKVGVVADKLHGEFQTVIKPLGPLFSRLKGFSGSSILGTGQVALILDLTAIAKISQD